jgi:uncharacterized protein (TIGR02284 family)
MNTDESIEVLNNLIVINNDRIEGYKTAYSETYEEELRSLFSMLEQTSMKCKTDLEAEVKRLGGTPEEGTKTSGKFYRVWMDIKAAVTGSDHKTILNSCEYGEKIAINAYEDALDEDIDDITFEQRAMLNSHLTMIKTDYEKVRAMQDMAEK